MKKILFVMMAQTITVVAGATNMGLQGIEANEQDDDSLRVEKLQEIVVSGVRTQKNAPFAVANIKRQELQQFSASGQELPFLFARTPGVTAWSENGLGTGTTYMRIRGAADSRINVTLDGVPLNSPEDQCVFWANMNSYASLLGSVQIQRGVGSSTNGDGAFGGTVALGSKAPSTVAGGEISGSFGGYNTFNVGGSFSTGLLWNHLIFDGAYHETNTDGFVHGTAGRSGSYYGGLTWLGDGFQIRYKNFGNFEKTGQAWYGVITGTEEETIIDGTYGASTGIKTYSDLEKAGLGRYNVLVEQLASLTPDADGKYHTVPYDMNGGRTWNKTTDNFWQNHNILSGAFTLGEHWNATASLHYTRGFGYYKDLKPNRKAGKKFGLTPNTVTDLVRNKTLDQNAYGVVGNVNYRDLRWDIVGGLSLQQFECDHYGDIVYIKDDQLRQTYLANGDYRYYDSDATKLDGNAYVKAAYRIVDDLQVFGDVQFRHVGFKTDGTNDNFVKDANGDYVNQVLNIDETYNFFNPKAGISYSPGRHHFFASAAMSHREPERNNFTDNGNMPYPKAEQLLDYEVGYNYASRQFRAGINLYYMDYKDQFVQTGAPSDIGEALTTNIKKSYRMGVELTAAWDICPLLTIEGNAALSQNKIKDFDEVVEDWDDWEGNTDAANYGCDGDGDGLRTIHYGNSTLAFSPSMILNGFIDFHYRGFKATWHTNFVSRQYMDNTENSLRSLPCYSVSNLSMSYTSKVTKVKPLKEVELGLQFNNLFNRRYAASGYVWYNAIYGSGGHTNDNRYTELAFIPMAPTTAMASLTLRF